MASKSKTHVISNPMKKSDLEKLSAVMSAHVYREEYDKHNNNISAVTSHELARLLLTLPDLPVATYAHGSTYISNAHRMSHGLLKVGRLESHAGPHIIIGDILECRFDQVYISEMFLGEAPDRHRR